MILRQRKPRVILDGYRKYLTTQPCMRTGYVMSDMGGPGVDPAHISFGNYARGMKADDWHCIPLVNDEHKRFDARQAEFTQEMFAEDPFLRMNALKALARWNYLMWAQPSALEEMR